MSTTSTLTNQFAGGDRTGVAEAQERRLAAVPTAVERAGSGVPNEDIDNLAVRIAGPGEGQSIADLAARGGTQRPAGALLVAGLEGRLLAAVSMSTGEGIAEPSASGAAAAAVLRYTLANSLRRRRTPHLARVAA
jgi:hypothetical protein